MSTISRTIKRCTIATAGVGLAFGLVAGPAGADVGAPPPPPTVTAKISLTNAVITGVVPTPPAGRPLESLSLNFGKIELDATSNAVSGMDMELGVAT